MHLVTANPEYAGRSRVMISNLEQSDDFEAACHNAFEKTAAQIQQQADAYLKAGNFGTTLISGRALSMTRDFKPVQLGSDERAHRPGRSVARQRPRGRSDARRTTRCKGPEASEGLALMELDDQKDNEAQSRASGCHRRAAARAPAPGSNWGA